MLRIVSLLLFAVFMFAFGISGGRMITDRTNPAAGTSTESSETREPPAPFGDLTESSAAHPLAIEDHEIAIAQIPRSANRLLDDQPVVDITGSSGTDHSTANAQAVLLNKDSRNVFLSSLSQVITDSTHAATTAESDQQSFAGTLQARPQLINLIIEMMPDATDQQVSAWAEQLNDLNLEEATFILEQRRKSIRPKQSMPVFSATLNTPVEDLLNGSESDNSALSVQPPTQQQTSPIADRQTSSNSHLDAAIEVVQSNLIGAHVPGHRASLVLLESSTDHPASVTAGNIAAPTFRTRIQFDPGRTVRTARALDVALPSDPHVMFCLLDGSVLSRRGDFEILSDGQIGLRFNGHEFPVYQSPVVPDNVCNVKITIDGRIFADVISASDKPFHNDPAAADGPSLEGLADDHATADQQLLGKVSVCRVQHLEQLSSDDGILFRIPASDSAAKPAVRTSFVKVQLAEGCLELSNSEISQQRAILQNLEQWRPANLRSHSEILTRGNP